MADTKLSDLTALTSVADGDLFYVVDISDTTDDAAGSSRKITRANLVTAVANSFTLGQTIAQTAGTGTQISALTVTGAAHTALTASTENIGVNLNMSATKQFATGALTTQREVVIQGPTYSAVLSSTITTAATLDITGAPIPGTNVTITNPIALRVSSGQAAATGLEVLGVASQSRVLVHIDASQSGFNANSFQITSPYGVRFRVDGNGYTYVESITSANGFVDSSSFVFGLSAGLNGLTLGSTRTVRWGAANYDNTMDVGLARDGVGVLKVNDGTAGTSGSGWIQNSAGVAILGSNFTSTSTTMANTNLSRTVIAGRKYSFRLLLPIDNATAGDGFKCDFDGGTATATTFYAVTHTMGVVTPGVDYSSALGTDLTTPSVTSTGFVVIEGTLVVNAGGTFILRAAKNSDAAGATMTLLAGARMELNDLVSV